MKKPVYQHLLLLILLIGSAGTVIAQTDSSDATSTDESSKRTEESEEAYRRRMELEGARDQETYSDVSYSSQAEEEAIDKLPEESKKNIRDQITDIIIEGGQWEPGDVLDEYPYEPTEAAEKDPVLMEQEQEAWAEQVDKYHEREASAFGAARPPMPGDENQQAQGGTSGNGEPGQDGAGEAGQNGGQSGEGGSDSAGSYQPYKSGSGQDGDEVSTAGVSESALDFLRGKQGQGPSGTGGSATREPPTGVAGNGSQAQGPDSGPEGAEEAQQNQAEQFAGSSDEPQEEPSQDPSGQTGDQQRAPDGSLPIEQLDQLRGIGGQVASGQATTPSAAQPNQAQQAGGPEAAADEAMAQAGDEPQQNPAAEAGEEAEQEQPADASEQAEQDQMAQASEDAQPESENPEQRSQVELDLSTPGIIAIRDLSKLEGVEEEQDDSP